MHRMDKIFNHIAVKVGHCCMKNMGAVTLSQNKQTLNPSIENLGCSCKVKDEYPLNNKCLTTNYLYEGIQQNQQ